MKYYSTNKQAPDASLEEAVVKGLAADKGLFMPYSIKPLPQDFYDSIDTLSFQEIAYRVADAFFGEDVPAETVLQKVVLDFGGMKRSYMGPQPTRNEQEVAK